MRFIKLTLPLILAFLFGIFGLGIQYMPHPAVSHVKETVAVWLRVIGGVAWILGAYNLLHLHVRKMQRTEQGWGYSVFFFAGFLAIAAAGFYNGGEGFWKPLVSDTTYDRLYNAFFVPAGATMFSLLGFFIVSAAVRTFRARSFEATLLLVTAVIVMLGRVPLGDMLGRCLPEMTEWLLAVPNTAAKRGVLMGVSLGGIATALRIIFGVERAYLGGSK